MYADSFEFNGIDSKDLNLYIMNFDGNNEDGVGSIGDEVTFTTTRAANSDKNNFHGYTRENPLTCHFQIGKNPCYEEHEFTREELAYIKAWLERKDGYKFLRFFQNGYEHTWFYCKIHVEWIRYGGKIVGIDCSVTCDAPYGYSDIQSIGNNNSTEFVVYNDDDEQGSIELDLVEINIKTSGDLVINNDLENKFSINGNARPLVIKNCVAGENIIIDGFNHFIKTNKNSTHKNKNICNDFNFNYLRLINFANDLPISYIDDLTIGKYPYYQTPRLNTFMISGCDADVNFAYRTRRSVMP